MITVCGRRLPVGARVVRWDEAGGYDAYATAPGSGAEAPTGLRYTPGRRVLEAASGERFQRPRIGFEELREQVTQFVLHYDGCGTSELCFDVLHEQRGLSVHFLLDVDGTIYQTLDLREQAWHARQANPVSIGVEIAQVGAYPPSDAGALDRWYAREATGTRLTVPERWAGRIATLGFRGRPARADPVRGVVQGQELLQYDFTPEQYDALVSLTVALREAFPRIAAEAPRDSRGRVRSDALGEAEWRAFEGILGHYHVGDHKVDPGPAFDWERYLERVRATRPQG